MKQKDLILIGAIALFAAVASFLISGQIFGSSDREQKVEVVKPISTSFTTPDSKYFNANSIDPTQNIQIGTSNNPAPFSTGQ